VTERGRIWILEDSPLEGELARRALSITQEVELFTDGSALLERAATSATPDAIVLDWALPGVSGLEVCRVLRETYDGMALPVLMLTGQGRKGDVLEALAAGANDYVTKPYDMAEVTARVATLVRTSRLHRAQARRAGHLALSADIGAALTKSKSLEEIGARSTLALATHLDATEVEVWVMRSGELELLASRPPRTSSASRPIVQDVAQKQEAFVVDDSSSTTVSTLPFADARGFAAMPLVIRDETLGVVVVGTAQPLGDAVNVLATVADSLAIGFARSRGEEERAGLLARERNSREEAEAANRSKDEFLAMVSHELRTPLNAITGWTAMLLAGGLDADRTNRALETITRNARSQAQLIDDLLDISRIVSGKLRLDVGKIELASIADLALESVRLAADSKGVVLHGAVDVAIGELQGDADRIQQIIWNLLTNAIKFTPKGGHVTLSVNRVSGSVEVAIQDSGQGIAPEFLPYVFDRFKQADATITRTKGGLGLGLAIVKHLVELHGGTIEAQSEGLGKGSTFRVLLPASGAEERSRASSAFASARPAALERPRELEGLRVLVLDDEEGARDLLSSILESCNVAVTTASNANDAFDAVRAQNVDLLISDIAMPVEDGLSFIKRVRALPREEGGRIPAVALTAYARLEDRTRALRAGFNSHVAKPVEPSELLAVLSSLAPQ
jgi:signal transduction histidine kinase/DNA-binding response OmpR family regulator